MDTHGRPFGAVRRPAVVGPRTDHEAGCPGPGRADRTIGGLGTGRFDQALGTVRAVHLRGVLPTHLAGLADATMRAGVRHPRNAGIAGQPPTRRTSSVRAVSVVPITGSSPRLAPSRSARWDSATRGRVVQAGLRSGRASNGLPVRRSSCTTHSSCQPAGTGGDRRGGGISACAPASPRAPATRRNRAPPRDSPVAAQTVTTEAPAHRSADPVRWHRGHSCSRRGLNRVRARPVVATDENRTRRRPRLQRSGTSPFGLQVPRLVEIRLLSTRCEHGRVLWIPDP
ncbi:hypothetical protein J2Z30_009750 [Streptomyces iranensis]|uniref:Uncharacterized protein n=1 Tax=Streptomyces iranensis TaxID=576784 RepID=A0ABS4NAN5_9ACTN|nr:hypothetical protein [Streptomyces iranensis]